VTYLRGGGSGSVCCNWGHAVPPLASLHLFTWEGLAQFGSPRPVTVAIWSGLGRSRAELASILTNGADSTLLMALSRTLVRLRNEMASIASRPARDGDSDLLYHLNTAEMLLCLLME